MNIISRIITPPKKVTFAEKGEVLLGTSGEALYRIENKANCTLSNTAEAKIEGVLAGLLGTKKSEDIVILLELGTAPEGTPNADQGYRLTIEEGKITLCGFGARGLLYAAVTLCQMLKFEDGKVSLPYLEIVDWPDLSRRGHYVECRFGSNRMELEDWKSVVDDIIEKKENILSMGVYGCWSVQFDQMVSEYLYVPFEKYPQLKTPLYTKYYSPKNEAWVNKLELPPMFEKDFLGELIVYGKEHGVEVFPFVNTYGHNSLLPRTFPEISAKYENGEPTLNGLCTRNPKTKELLFELLDSIIDRYLAPNGITSIDIGLDEVGDGDYLIGVNPDDIWKSRPQFCRCELCKGAQPKELFIDHAITLIKHLKKKGMKNIYLCNDVFYRRGRPAEADLLETFRNRLIDEDLLDVTVLNWWNYVETESKLAFGSEDIIRSGVRGITKPMNGYYHWHLYYPRLNNSYFLLRHAYEAKCEGFISYSGWDNCFDCNNSAQAQFAWNFEGAGKQDDVLLSYCKRVFPTLAQETFEAFKALNACVAGGRGFDENGRPVLSTITLLEKYMSYYFFSYIAKGKPYPRNFPGEGVQMFLSNYEEATSLMESVHNWANKARDIFLKASITQGCDKYFATRYAWEADNIVTLCEDWEVLLYMHKLCSARLTPGAMEEIKNLAAERKNDRIRLMAKAEEIKESYLLSSHMRNQSIFMQIFADIEAYLTNTPFEQVELDFTDLSPIGSAEYKNLR